MPSYSLTPDVFLYHADARDALRALSADSIDSVCTDPPYHLTSMVRRLGNASLGDDTHTSARSRAGADGMARMARGFMGKTWDGGDIAFQPAFWAEVLRVMKPGAHLVAFGASRGYHRMACAIEDAGFEIRDSLMWIYSTGFPKSHDVSKGIDKALGAVREVVGESKYASRASNSGMNYDGFTGVDVRTLTAPATPEAAQWEGWGTALKPAFEPIVLARKPLSESTVAANVLRWGTGALNIDACRIHVEGESTAREYTAKRTAPGPTQNATGERHLEGVEFTGTSKEGRWPANVLHDGSDEVVGGFPSSKSTPFRANDVDTALHNGGIQHRTAGGFSDSGSAARFFYSPKASKADRAGSKHPTVKHIGCMEWLCQLVTPPGGYILDPFAGSGTTGAAAVAKGFKAILCEREAEYVADIQRRFAQVASPSIQAGEIPPPPY